MVTQQHPGPSPLGVFFWPIRYTAVMLGFLRYLRIAFSATCLAACVLLTVLWWRSYSACVTMNLGPFDSFISFTSDEGTLLFAYPADNFGTQVKFINVPSWFTVLIAATLAVLPWIQWSKRFSLRTLLIATTLIALMLGIIVWMWRAG
jgi:hypothetical protein